MTVTVTGAVWPDRRRPAVPHRFGRPARAPMSRFGCDCSRSPRALQGCRRHRDGARRLRFPAAGGHRHHRRRRASAFDGTHVALLVGARPRTAGMERGYLLEAKAGPPARRARHQREPGRHQGPVVGNPANTTRSSPQQHAPGFPVDRFTAMTRLDHNRALCRRSRAAPLVPLPRSSTSRSGATTPPPSTRTCTPRSGQRRRAPPAGRGDVAQALRLHPDRRQVAAPSIIEARGRVVGRLGRERRDRPCLPLGERQHRAGPRPPSSLTVLTAFRKGSSRGSPSRPGTGSTRSSAGWRSTSSAGTASTAQ